MGSDKEVKVVDDVKTKKSTDKKSNAPEYPIRGNRYSMFGWNHYYQDCYDKNDLTLLKKIKSEYDSAHDKKSEDHHFDLNEEKAMHDWWTCQRPASSGSLPGTDGESYTLPSREAKDEKQFPLWQYADSMARQIANWQAERIKNQDISLMNDPVMLAFDEIRDWLFNELSAKECKKEVVDYISARQSYVKHLIHMAPNFGPDRLNLYEIQHSLEEASRTITHCVANKELPQLLSTLTAKSNDLETATATYLHFLLINQEVADNFTPTNMDRSLKNCESSPVCKIYKAAQNKKTDSLATSYSNQFYTIEKISSNQKETQLEMKLKLTLADQIKFATFVTADTKEKYIQSMALLESLTNVRETLNKFQHIQSRIGTYVFAINYLDQVDQLSSNYINLVGKVGSLIKDIIHAADDGLNLILKEQGTLHKENNYFEKNLRSLETKIAKGVTISALIDTYCKNSIDSMNKYQQEIKKLVRNVQSGDAARELEKDMQDLYVEMTNLNTVLPAILQGQKRITIDNNPVKFITSFANDQERLCTNLNSILPCNNEENECSINLNFDNIESIDQVMDSFQQTSGAESSRPTPSLFAPIKLLSEYASQAFNWLAADNSRPVIPPLNNSTSYINMQMAHFPSTPVYIPATDTPKMIASTDKHTDMISAPTYNNSLTIESWLYVGQYVGHFIKKYSPYTLPWNRKHDLSQDEVNHLLENKNLLRKLSKTFSYQKCNADENSGIFIDQYAEVEKTLTVLEININKSLKRNQSTGSCLSEIDTKLTRVADMIHKITQENDEVKKFQSHERFRTNLFNKYLNNVNTHADVSTTVITETHRLGADGN